jgi:hypothetical protein
MNEKDDHLRLENDPLAGTYELLFVKDGMPVCTGVPQLRPSAPVPDD